MPSLPDYRSHRQRDRDGREDSDRHRRSSDRDLHHRSERSDRDRRGDDRDRRGDRRGSHDDRERRDRDRDDRRRTRDYTPERDRNDRGKRDKEKEKEKEKEKDKDRKKKGGMPFMLPAYVAKVAGSVLTPYHQSLQTRVYIGGIPTTVTDDAIRQDLSRFGLIANVAMAWDTDKDQSRGWCFVDFEEPKGATELLKMAPGAVQLGGKSVRVSPPNNPLGTTRPPRAMTYEEAHMLVLLGMIEPTMAAQHAQEDTSQVTY
eukprot:PhM_4_TR18614/c3_g3_i1/m.83707